MGIGNREYIEWRKMLYETARQAGVSCTNASGIIVFDTETTGLYPDTGRDEILQISIIDGEGNELLDSYVKPRWHSVWPMATAVNGITPEMVAGAPAAEELIPVVKGIFESADTLIAYNGSFDLSFLRVWGIGPVKGQTVVDVMPLFAEIYGEWNDYYGNYRWQKLTTAAAYYGYEFSAHNSLEDARATLYVYNKMRTPES